MFETILVYMVEANAEAAIIQQAACIAKNMQANVLVYHPFSSTGASSSNDFVDPLNWSMKKAEAESTLKRICEDLAKDNIQAFGEVIENNSSELFIEYAMKHDVSIIIAEKSALSSNDTLSDFMKASTIPVLSLPNDSKPNSASCFKRILIPLDGSKRAECALPFAVSLSEKLQSEIVCVHIIQPPSFPRSIMGNDDKMSILAEQLVENSRQNARDYLRQVIGRYSVPINAHVIVSSDVGSSLHQVIEDEAVDLVVLSAHGTSGNPKWPLGSIANNLVAYSLSPTMLIQDLPVNQDTQEIAVANHLQRKNR